MIMDTKTNILLLWSNPNTATNTLIFKYKNMSLGNTEVSSVQQQVATLKNIYMREQILILKFDKLALVDKGQWK